MSSAKKQQQQNLSSFSDICLGSFQICFAYKLNNMHYVNTPMQYTAILWKIGNFQMKKCGLFFLFLLKKQTVGTR